MGNAMPKAIQPYKNRSLDGLFSFQRPGDPCLFINSPVHAHGDLFHDNAILAGETRTGCLRVDRSSARQTDFVGWSQKFPSSESFKTMLVGDAVLFYESVTTKAIVGAAEVSKSAYPDPSADEEGWVSVEIKAVRTLPRRSRSRLSKPCRPLRKSACFAKADSPSCR